MKKHGRDNRPYLKPVTRIELSEGNIKLRWILIVVLLSIAVVSIGSGVAALLNTQPGWNEVAVSTDQANCSSEFTLMYDFTDAGGSATAVNKKLISLYSEACVMGYKLFSPDVLEEGLGNVGYLNAHINEAVTVDPVLYRALSLLGDYENRNIFLAPVYMEYDRVFNSESDGEAASYDPSRNPELMAYITDLSGFAFDPEMIRIELLPENQVILYVSDAYLEYARENGIEEFLDFGWMKNAFIADYLAEQLAVQGFTSGYLSSFDGFTRNLDDRGEVFSQNLFDLQGTVINMPARMHYSGPRSLVFLRSYPMHELDRWHYYTYETGEIVTAMIDPADGVSKSACPNLFSYSSETGCAQILMELLPLYLTDTLNMEEVNSLTEEGIYSIWFENKELKYNDPGLEAELFTDSQDSSYSKAFAK